MAEKMEQRFTYKYDRRTKWTSFWISLAVAGGIAAIFLLTDGMYVKVWLLTIFAAALALYILSIPRYLKVNSEAVEIHCIVEMTKIPLGDIASIGSVTREEYGRLIPTLGSYGFFGYYGYFYSTRYWSSVKVYATQMNDMVEIEDIFEQKYIVSCSDAARFIESVEKAKAGLREAMISSSPEAELE